MDRVGGIALLVLVVFSFVACRESNERPEDTAQSSPSPADSPDKNTAPAASAASASARTNPSTALPWELEAPPEKRAAVVHALGAFEAACGADFAPNIAYARAKYGRTRTVPGPNGMVSPGEFMLEKLGWPDYVEARLKLKNGAAGIFERGDDHVLWFWIGSGAKPGIRVAPKRWALAACGLREGEPGADVIKAVPALGGVLGDAPEWWDTWAERVDMVSFPPKQPNALNLLGREPRGARKVFGRESPGSTGKVGSTLYLKWENEGLEIDIIYEDDVAKEVSFVFKGMDRVQQRVDELSQWAGFDVTKTQCVRKRLVEVDYGRNSIDLRMTDRPCS